MGLLLDQINWISPKKSRDQFQSLERHIAFASFNGANVSAVQSAALGESFLRKALLLPEPAKVPCQICIENELAHLSKNGEMMTNRLQTICSVVEADEHEMFAVAAAAERAAQHLTQFVLQAAEPRFDLLDNLFAAGRIEAWT